MAKKLRLKFLHNLEHQMSNEVELKRVTLHAKDHHNPATGSIPHILELDMMPFGGGTKLVKMVWLAEDNAVRIEFNRAGKAQVLLMPFSNVKDIWPK